MQPRQQSNHAQHHKTAQRVVHVPVPMPPVRVSLPPPKIDLLSQPACLHISRAFSAGLVSVSVALDELVAAWCI
jgi:hypothetical protein